MGSVLQDYIDLGRKGRSVGLKIQPGNLEINPSIGRSTDEREILIEIGN